jgi:hypothetical protein
MWDQMTEKGRAVVYAAQEAAGEANTMEVDAELLLVGVLLVEDTVAQRVLQTIAVVPGDVIDLLRKRAARQPCDAKSPYLGASSKKALEQSLKEARKLGNNYIGTEHMLLGCLWEMERQGIRDLAELGLTASRARQETEALLLAWSASQDKVAPIEVWPPPPTSPSVVRKRRTGARRRQTDPLAAFYWAIVLLVLDALGIVVEAMMHHTFDGPYGPLAGSFGARLTFCATRAEAMLFPGMAAFSAFNACCRGVRRAVVPLVLGLTHVIVVLVCGWSHA